MSLLYLPYEEIDKNKWDDCVSSAQNSLIYARSFYLDYMAGKWDAIVSGNYDAVMPLPWKRKWGIKYFYQPAFIQQGGIFSPAKVEAEMITGFIDLLKTRAKFAEITMNYGNLMLTGVDWEQRTNYVLSLERLYDEQYTNYLPSFTKSLRRIRKFNLVYKGGNDYRPVIALYKKLYGSKLPFYPRDYAHFEKICDRLATEKKIYTRLACNSEKKLLAAVILLADDRRLYNIISCITADGKKVEANYFLYDEIIHEFSGSPIILDLEGSDVKGIAAFYKKFNPDLQPYPFIKINNLPPALKLFKK